MHEQHSTGRLQELSENARIRLNDFYEKYFGNALDKDLATVNANIEHAQTKFADQKDWATVEKIEQFINEQVLLRNEIMRQIEEVKDSHKSDVDGIRFYIRDGETSPQPSPTGEGVNSVWSSA